MKSNFKLELTSMHFTLLILILVYISIAVFLGPILQHDFLRGDVFGYWQDSLNWREPFHKFHVPGYPLMIALVHSISFKTIHPLALMQGINLIAFVTSILLVYRIIQLRSENQLYAAIGAYVFGLWPFVGSVLAIIPFADLPAMALYLGGVYILLRSRTWIAALPLGLSLITHKALWPVVGLTIIAHILHNKLRFSLINISAIVILIIPLGALWILGALYHGHPTWIISKNLEAEVMPQSALPVLDGLIGTTIQGGVQGLLKGGFIIGITIMTAAISLLCYKIRPTYFRYGIAISSSLLFWFIMLNQDEIWAAVRFSRLLVLPMIWLLASIWPVHKPKWLNARSMVILFSSLYATQLFFAWYIARVFFT